MTTKSVSDFVAASMDAFLNSEEHKALFGTQYKFAQDLNAAKDKCAKCSKDKDACMCGDSAMADDNAAGKKGKCKDCGKPEFLCGGKCKSDASKADDSKDSSGDSSKADDNEAKKRTSSDSAHASDGSSGDSKDSSKADDSVGDSKDSSKADDSKDSSKADDDDLKSSAAFAVAIDSLLNASAALDSVGMEKSAALSLKLATLVVEAKKKDSDSKKDKNAAKDKAAKEKAKKEKDAQAAKDKAAKEKEKAKKERDTNEAKEKASKEKAAKEKAAEKEKAEKEKAKAKASKKS